jgi:hypothetical protein
MKKRIPKIDRQAIAADILEAKKAVVSEAVKESRKRGKYKAKTCLLDEFAKKLFSFERLTGKKYHVALVTSKTYDPAGLVSKLAYNVCVNGFECRVSGLQGAIDFLHGLDFALAMVENRLVVGNGQINALAGSQKMMGAL